MVSPLREGRTLRIAGFAIALAACIAAPRAADAQVDMNGPWVASAVIVFGPFFDCTFDIVQSGSDLTITGDCLGPFNATATIDTGTGAFTGSGTSGGACPMFTFTNGMANPNNQTFNVGFQCNGGAFPFLVAINGFRCGNGVIDAIAGENCEDGNSQNGDCCSSTCVLDAAASPCFTDVNVCTADQCDGAGTCEHLPIPGDCDDNNQCTDNDTCSGGVCGGTALPDNSSCTDFELCTTESCQAGICQATNLPDDTPCDDGDPCFQGETCQDGLCQYGTDEVQCPACMACNYQHGCVPITFNQHTSNYAVEDFIDLKKADPDRAKWRWESYSALDIADFGHPDATTNYEFCVFDEFNFDPVTGAPRLVFSLPLPAGPNWKPTASGFLFKSADGVKVRLKAGIAGKAKILIKNKSSIYDIQYLPPLDSLDVQLRAYDGGDALNSFRAFYFPPVISTDTHYRGQSPLP